MHARLLQHPPERGPSAWRSVEPLDERAERHIRIRLHDVRHTYATAVLEAAEGWHDVKVLSQRLGHRSVGATLDTYASSVATGDENG